MRNTIYEELVYQAEVANIALTALSEEILNIIFKKRSPKEISQFITNNSDIWDEIKEVFIPF